MLHTVLLASAVMVSASPGDSPGVNRAGVARFERSLEGLRRQLKIPGLSAAIVSRGRMVWARGFGYADRERGVAATPDTPSHLASVTKPLAAVVVLQLVEEGVIGLDDPVSDHGLSYAGPGVVRVRHLLSHTSRGEPGLEFAYDSDRFADLGWVVARASGRSFRQLVMERIVTPLQMENTAPSPLSMGDGVAGVFGAWLGPRNVRVHARLARPYALDESFAVVDGSHPIVLSPASGLISSVSDLARFDAAIDEHRLLPPAATARMLRPTLTPDGRRLPYGLGWFSQTHEATRLVWHYGWNPPTASALYMKMPDQGLTLIVLANTDALSRPFDLGRGDRLVLDSPVALAFYETFVLEPRRGRILPAIDWEADEDSLIRRLRETTGAEEAETRDRELLSYRRIFHGVGRASASEKLAAVHRRVYRPSSSAGETGLPALGEHLRPWPSVPLFGMAHVLAFAWYFLVLLTSLALWLARVARSLVRRRSRAGGPGARETGGATALLAALVILAGLGLYGAVLAEWPAGGTVTWSAGDWRARGLLVASAASGVLALVLTIQTAAGWRARRGSVSGRLHRTTVAMAVVAASWGLLDLAGWL